MKYSNTAPIDSDINPQSSLYGMNFSVILPYASIGIQHRKFLRRQFPGAATGQIPQHQIAFLAPL